MIDFNILIICTAFLVVFRLHSKTVRALAGTPPAPVEIAPIIEPDPVAIETESETAEAVDEEPPAEESKPKEDDPALMSVDDLIDEYNKIESRGKPVHSVSPIKRKQQIAAELRRREKRKL